MAATCARAMGARVAVLGGRRGASTRVSGIAAALPGADAGEQALLYNDVLRAGYYINNRELVAAMVRRIGQEIVFLNEMGVPFHHCEASFSRRQAAGSSQPWAVFSLEMVGIEICRQLLRRLRTLEKPPFHYLSGALLLDLHLQDGAVAGGLAYVPSEGRWIRTSAPAVILATGGAGQLFGNTTNFSGSWGTGHALALEAGARLVDTEFTSFEPFIMAAPPHMRGYDLPTTVLRQGARLRNGLGEEFLDTRQPFGKDVICRAMLREVAEGRGTPSAAIYFDLREMAPEVMYQYVHFRRALERMKLLPSDALLEVMPAQHSIVGGVRIDHRTATGVVGLFAVGETSGGVHGAHRLASCGGTEAVALGALSGESAALHALASSAPSGDTVARPMSELLDLHLSPEDLDRLKTIRSALDQGCGILRSKEGLEASLARLQSVRDDLQSRGRMKTFIGRAATVALAMVSPALARRESRGDHFRVDHPRRDDTRWLGNLCTGFDQKTGDVELTYERAAISYGAVAELPSN